MCSFPGRALATIVLTAAVFACATGGDASVDTGAGADAGRVSGDGGSAADAGLSTERDSGSSVDSGFAIDSGVTSDTGAPTDSGNPPSDAFVPPQDSGLGQDSATQQINCDTSTQANQQKYLAEYLVAAASQNPKPCGTCSAGECCFQILCVAQ